MAQCLFCSILEKKIPAKIAGEGKDWLAFHDINPQAPVHVLIIPRKHIEKIDDVSTEDLPMLSSLVEAAQRMAKKLNVHGGYRLVFNNGADAGQSVFHVHLHLLGGRRMNWPPG